MPKPTRELLRNVLFERARKLLPSPSGAPRPMSRRELADAINAYLHTQHGVDENLNQDDIGRIERGVTRWPGRWRRLGCRAVLGAESDAELGFYFHRQSGSAIADEPSAGGSPLQVARVYRPFDGDSYASPNSHLGRVDPTAAVAVGDPGKLNGQPAKPASSRTAAEGDGDGPAGRPPVLPGELGDIAAEYARHGGEWWLGLDLSERSDLSGLSIQKPTPSAVSWTEVEQVRFITRMLAQSENLYGGGLSGEAAAAQLRHSAGLVEARATDDVRRAMSEAVGNLSEVVGFSAFDVADFASARRCFAFALWCAQQASSWSLRASALSDMARLAIYLGSTDDALLLVELAQVRSDRISATARAMLGAIRARLLALQGRHSEALAEVERSDGYFAERNVADDPPWLCYYDQAEHEGSTARALIPIAISTKDVSLAAPRLENAVQLHDTYHPRSREFSRTRLASLLMRVGDAREAVAIGRAALTGSTSLRSSRLRSEIQHLGELAAAHEYIVEVADLRHEVMAFTTADRN